VAYLAEVLPFTTLVERHATPSALRSFLWVNGKGVWDTACVTKALTRETSIRLGLRITFQDYRHMAKAIDREHVRRLVSAYTSSTADDIYGIDVLMLYSLSARTMNAFRAVSDRWHQFLRVNSRQQWPRTRALSDSSACLPGPKRHRSLVGVDIEKEMQLALERLLGPGATFRSKE
jgi:hypothetical protein